MATFTIEGSRKSPTAAGAIATITLSTYTATGPHLTSILISR